jgi:hypothetical protein
MLSYTPGLPQGHDLRCNGQPSQGVHHSCLQEVQDLDSGFYGGHWGFHQINCISIAYKLCLKFSSKCIHPNYFFYWFECFQRVCHNLSSAPCIYLNYHCPMGFMFLHTEAMMEGLLSVEPAGEVQVPFSLLMGMDNDKLELPISFELRISSPRFCSVLHTSKMTRPRI